MEAAGRVCGLETEDAPKTATTGDAQMAVYGGELWQDRLGGWPATGVQGCDARIAPKAMEDNPQRF